MAKMYGQRWKKDYDEEKDRERVKNSDREKQEQRERGIERDIWTKRKRDRLTEIQINNHKKILKNTEKK